MPPNGTMSHLSASIDMKNKVFRVYEHQVIRLEPHGSLSRQDLKTLFEFHETKGAKYYELINNGVRFKHYVGVLKTQHLTIEVLPKIDKKNTPEYGIWRDVLLNMLQVTKDVKVHYLSNAKLAEQYNSILDIYITLFIQEVHKLINQGLVRKYQKRQGNYSTLKGKLLFTKNIQHNLTRKERFYCEKSEFQIDHIPHQIIKQALEILNLIGGQEHLAHIKPLLYYFDSVKKRNFNKTDIDNVKLDRKSLRYKTAIDLARMFILNYSPSISSGQQEMICLMFNMNKLWEEYIYTILDQNRPKGTSVSFQNHASFWNNRKIRPDIVISRNGDKKVIDTKWKIISRGEPSDSDLKQIFSYNLLWNAEQSILLYPKIDQSSSNFGNFHYSDGTRKNQCKTAFVSIIECGKLRTSKEIAQDIFNEFLN